MQKSVSECYIIEWFIRTIVEWSAHSYIVHNLIQSDLGGLHVVKNRMEYFR